jgi:hypothetical protein
VVLVVSSLGAGMFGVATAVDLRYVAVRRVDGIGSLGYAVNACVRGFAAAAMLAVFVLVARRWATTSWPATLPFAFLGGLLWRSVPDPPGAVAAAGLWLVLFAPLPLLLGMMAVPFLVSDRRATRSERRDQAIRAAVRAERARQR